MTNSEKYLKDGVNRYQFAKEIQDCFGEEIPLVDETILDWLADDSKPTLTEDERAILRHLKGFYYIYRTGTGELEATNKEHTWCGYELYLDDDVFQFIKNGEEYEIKELLGDEK